MIREDLVEQAPERSGDLEAIVDLARRGTRECGYVNLRFFHEILSDLSQKPGPTGTV